MDMITLTIDGQTVTAKKGATVLEAAKEAGVFIPTLCAHPSLKPYGACRLCIVEIEKMRGLPASCTTPASEGMVVNTISPKVVELRKKVLEFILTEHPNGCLVCHKHDICDPMNACLREVKITERCLTCPKDKRCELQMIVDYVSPRPTPMRLRRREKNIPVDNSNPFIWREHETCILCARCVRACSERSLVGAIDFVNRGNKTYVGTVFDRPLQDTNCEFCGCCIASCPTGAVVEKPNRYVGVAEHQVKTTCPYCGVGCGLVLEIKEGKIVRVNGNEDSVVNNGDICVKGRFGYDFVHSEERLKKPLIRKNGVLEEASWDEALTLVTEKLGKYKGDQFAMVSSAKATNEDNYAIQKFARGVMGTNNVDHCARL